MDKTKLIDSAARYVAKGQIEKAIKEYENVLSLDAKDVRAIQKLAELYSRKGENDKAADQFEKVAESYAEQGFFLKSVAVYKQILKIVPGRVESNLRLAELYQQLGLLGDASKEYQTVAAHFEKQGDAKKSLDTLRRMVDLDPENVDTRRKLGELYARQNMNKEAASELRRAAQQYKKANRDDDFGKCVERVVQLEPNDMELTRELAHFFLRKGDSKRALSKLQICFKANPRDVETLTLLGDAFRALGQTSKTVSVYRELARIHADARRFEPANEALKRILEMQPEDQEAREELQRLESAARAPAPAAAAPPPQSGRAAIVPPPPPQQSAPAPRAAEPSSPAARAAPPTQPVRASAPAHAPPAPGGNAAVSKLLTETDVYLKYGLQGKALEHLQKIFAVDPNNLDAKERAKTVYLAQGKTAEAADALAAVMKAPDAARAGAAREELARLMPGHPALAGADAAAGGPEPEEEVEVTEEEEAVAGMGDELAGGAEEDVLAGEAFEEDSSAEIVEEEPVLAPSEGDGEAEEFPTVSEDEVPDIGEEAGSAGRRAEDEVRSIDDEELPLLGGSESPGSKGLDFGEDELSEALGLESSPAPAQPAAAARTRAPAPAEPPPGEDDLLVEEEPAREVAPPPPPARPAPAARATPAAPPPPPARAKPAAPPPTPARPAPAARATPTPAPARAAPAPPAPAHDDYADDVAEAQFLIEQGLPDDAREIVEGILLGEPDHAGAQAILRQLEGGEAPGGGPSAGGFGTPAAEPQRSSPAAEELFDLGKELSEEFAKEEEETPLPPPPEDFQIAVDEVLAEFKRKLATAVKPEDAQTHFDLGIAFKEMGLYDEALEAFRTALGGRASGKRADCHTMVGLCLVAKGEAADAIGHFKRALDEGNLAPDADRALHYEMGVAYESLYQLREAADQFAKVAAGDPGFRDVRDRIARLARAGHPVTLPENGGAAASGAGGSASGAEPAAAPGDRRRSKIGYV